ncbi:MAG TPA: hypothetical protein VN442_09910 [Bryobacteraceae bacterium]|nr:hypothetical protein [Bryobacteraceae bacterium]
MRISPGSWTRARRAFPNGGSGSRRTGASRAPATAKPRRVLALLDQPVPEGYAQRNGPLLAEALGDVSADQVWRILRSRGIQLQRRRRWCITTDPEFGPKAAAVVVVCVDEKPHIQALQRAQGYLRLPAGRAVNGFSHCYKRHGTTTLFAALDVVTSEVETGHYARRRRREFLDFTKSWPRTQAARCT